MIISIYSSVDIILFSCIILLVLIFHAVLNRATLPVSARYRTLVAITVLIILLFDFFSRIRFPSGGLNFNHGFAFVTNFFYLVLQPLPVTFGLMYIFSLFREQRITGRNRVLFFIPFAVGCVAMLYSLFTGFVFYIDDNNIYHRGPGMIIFALTNYSFIIPAVGLIMHHRDTVKRQVLAVVISFTLIPVIGSLLQLLFYGLITAWPSFTIALLITFIFLEGRRNDRDYLTGLLNRQSFHAKINTRMEQYAKKGTFFLVVIDLDKFKLINDTYGHETGDEVLQLVSNVLFHSVAVQDTVARYGGDEFVMSIDSDNPMVMESVMMRIQSQLDTWNANNLYTFDLSLSAGFVTYNPKEHTCFEDLFRQADMMMFKVKDRKNANRTDSGHNMNPKSNG